MNAITQFLRSFVFLFYRCLVFSGCLLAAVYLAGGALFNWVHESGYRIDTVEAVGLAAQCTLVGVVLSLVAWLLYDFVLGIMDWPGSLARLRAWHRGRQSHRTNPYLMPGEALRQPEARICSALVGFLRRFRSSLRRS